MEATFGNSSPRRNVVRQLTLVFSGLLLLTLLLGLVSLYRIAQTLDERERGQSRFHAESVMAQLHKNERSYMVAYAFWQAAYEHLTGTVDRRWAYEEDNLGVTLYSDDGYQGVFVLNDDGTHYATLEGRISEQPFDRHSNSRAQLLQRARKAAQQQEATSGYLQFDGQPALYAAAVIRPAANSEPPPSPTGAVLVFVRLLDTEKLGELGRSAGLSGFAVTTASQGPADMGRLPLEDSGYTLTWHVEQPGTDLLRTVVIPLALAVLIIAVLMALFARHAMRASAGIDRSYRDLAASKAALESSEARFKAVAEAASDWIWETDAQQHLTYLSPRFAELTGHPLERWLQRPIGELFTCDTRQVDDWLHGLASSEATGTLRCQYQDRHEQRRECRVAARAIVEHKTCKGYRGTCTDITDEVAAHAQIQHLSLHDALTGLPNRNKLFRFLEDAGQAELGLLMLDLDNFKPINDSLGHPAGDAVLIEVAHRLGQVTRESDLVARLGGDEFVIVLARPGKHDEVDRFCARVIETLQQPIQFEQHKVQIGVSLGVVLSAEYPGIASDLIRYADVALYSAKQAGKHTWRYFSAELNTTLLEKRALERELRAGIGRGELRLHFQPRYKVDGVTVASAEALVRWQHPRLGLLRPDHFIALAEESDLIVQLGNWVLEQACSLARGWPLDILVSVNMSPAQFSRSDVVRDVAEALRHTGLPAHRLELEITENVMLNDVEGALQTMNALKELGVRLNMDDFGTGYSSLGYLRTYPFDSIKIDKRFVQSLGTSSSDRSVVQAIINLGNAMGMTVTAEGVETAEQLALLSDDQCHEVQGYLLSRPVENQVLMRIMAGEEAARSRSL
ncbi:bifunctional diguanylate cyclase/phosphodiesterase [Pseudomonas sp. AFG_SD02_1510_Pfu_092]|uniref:bifunctional diguanylate cyclase/phosphodiesterase n=1 Tax=Pseudomonas sp. AFG_SD02_1510_Pfu_092 TaxID=2259497 RepID=UPI000DEF5C62|nr:EAL domain-containing protein [Pseudomonas sp. AFG_SD02_1510_Pfu_092]RCL21025.1 bifunctional diguanylate cyclase/phosphodiesterase [Pseudomonas sp. AFG_SD02_1510_Pfu_092]